MREKLGVGSRRERHRSITKVEAGALGGRRDDRQRLDPDLLELRRRPSQLDELAPAERSVQAAQEYEKDRAPAAVIGQRYVPRSMDGRERKVWRWFARLQACSSHGAHASLQWISGSVSDAGAARCDRESAGRGRVSSGSRPARGCGRQRTAAPGTEREVRLRLEAAARTRHGRDRPEQGGRSPPGITAPAPPPSALRRWEKGGGRRGRRWRLRCSPTARPRRDRAGNGR